MQRKRANDSGMKLNIADQSASKNSSQQKEVVTKTKIYKAVFYDICL